MKKAPVLVVGLVILFAVLLGVMMYSVDSEEDDEGILTSFNNMNNLIKRPISVEEIIRQLEQSNDEDDTGTNPGNPTAPSPPGTNPTPGDPGETGSTEPPQEGEYSGEKTLSGTLQYIPQGNWWGSKYMDISALRLGGKGDSVQSSGCYFCSLTMASAFLRGKAVTRQEAEKSCNNSNNFIGNLAKGNDVLKSYGVNKSITGDNRLSLDEVKASINSNKPLIIHFKGATSGGYYSGSGHFALCVGYSDTDSALVLYDPGKGPGSIDKKLTYKEYSDGVSKGNLFMRSFN